MYPPSAELRPPQSGTGDSGLGVIGTLVSRPAGRRVTCREAKGRSRVRPSPLAEYGLLDERVLGCHLGGALRLTQDLLADDKHLGLQGEQDRPDPGGTLLAGQATRP